jgi:hypothetical protein
MMQWPVLLLFLSYLYVIHFNDDEIVRATARKVTTRAGEISRIDISVSVKDGYHIQSNKINNEFIIPTTVKLNPDNGFKIKKIVFPSSKKFKLEGFDNDLEVYDGNFDIGVTLRTANSIERGIHHLRGELNYQACDSVRCFSPKGVPFLIEVAVQ